MHITSGQTLAVQGTATTTGTFSGGNIKTVTDPATGAIGIQMADAPKFGNVVVNDGGTGKISGVAAGDLNAGSGDAVNGDQLFTTNQNVTNLQNEVSGLNVPGLVLQDATSRNLTVGAATDGKIVSFAGTQGPRTLTGVDAGAVNATSTDAVNGSQLNAVQTVANRADQNASGALTQVNEVAKSAVSYDDSTHTAVTLNKGGQSVALGNVGAGSITSTSTDAVNGSQLYTTDQNVTNLQNAVNSLTVTTSKPGLVLQDPTSRNLTVGAATDGKSVSFAGTQGSRTLTGVDAGAVNATSTDAVNGSQLYAVQTVADRADQNASDALGQIKSISSQVDAVASSAVTYDDASHTSVTLNKGGQSVALGNVGAGSISDTSTDAVNGSQLYATNNRVDANTAAIAANTADIAQTEGAVTQVAKATQANTTNVAALQKDALQWNPALAGGKGAYDAGHGTDTAQTITHVAAGTLAANSTDAVNGAQLNATNQNVAVAQQTANSAVTMGENSIQYDQGGRGDVTLNPGGNAAVLHNVGPGTSPTDAVNLGQLNSGLANTLNQANGYTDQQIASVRFDLRQVDRRMQSGIAGANALSGIPQAFERGMGMVGGAVGTHGGYTAFAVGLSKAMNDGHTVVKAGFSYETVSGTVNSNVGVGYGF